MATSRYAKVMGAAPGPGNTWTRGRRALQQWLCRARLASVPAAITAKTDDFQSSALQKPRPGRHACVEITVCPHGRGCMKSVQGFRNGRAGANLHRGLHCVRREHWMGHDNPNLSPTRGPSVWAQPRWDGRRTRTTTTHRWLVGERVPR